ncbi:MAG: hypothetical protein HYZ61_00765 [Candidatus Andersenbacteria bacterium]|nr:hypothetical protein [Candidatus Andersenbacteria bacterium]
MIAYIIIFHLVGVILGAGGAVLSDAMFFSSIRDRKLTKTELRFMRMGSHFVWAGLAILVTTGTIIFSSNPEFYMASTKFLAKVTIVSLIILNGIFIHIWHIPRFRRHAGHHLPSSDEFMRARPYLMVSGALSTTSWIWAFVLGSLSSLPFSYSLIMTAYGANLIFAGVVALLLMNHLIPHHRHT